MAPAPAALSPATSGREGCGETPALLGAAARGDNRAWEEIVRRYGGLVTATVRTFRLQEADAADAEQRTWLRLVEHHRRLHEPEHLGGWLTTTATRECLAILRAQRTVVDLADLDAVPADHDLEQHVVDADEAARLWNVVTLLPPRGRAVVHALFADERTPYAEIARATGIPVGSLGPTRARVLRQLRRLLAGSAGGGTAAARGAATPAVGDRPEAHAC